MFQVRLVTMLRRTPNLPWRSIVSDYFRLARGSGGQSEAKYFDGQEIGESGSEEGLRWRSSSNGDSGLVLIVADQFDDLFGVWQLLHNHFQIVLARTGNPDAAHVQQTLTKCLIELDVANIIVLDFGGLA